MNGPILTRTDRPTKNVAEYNWRWDIRAGRQMLVTDGGGTLVVLSGQDFSPILTRGSDGFLRPIEANDHVARIVANANSIRRHAQSFIHGIDIGMVTISTDADEALATIMSGLRSSLRDAS